MFSVYLCAPEKMVSREGVGRPFPRHSGLVWYASLLQQAYPSLNHLLVVPSLFPDDGAGVCVHLRRAELPPLSFRFRNPRTHPVNSSLICGLKKRRGHFPSPRLSNLEALPLLLPSPDEKTAAGRVNVRRHGQHSQAKYGSTESSLLVGHLNRETEFPLRRLSPLRLRNLLRETGSAVPPCVNLLILHTILSHRIPPVFLDGVH